MAGVFSAAGNIGMLRATRFAPANQLAPTHYSQIIWAVLIGVVIFDEHPILVHRRIGDHCRLRSADHGARTHPAWRREMEPVRPQPAVVIQHQAKIRSAAFTMG